MKTKLFYVVLLVLAALTGCQEEENREVKESFRKYATENFGNPKSLKEITAVEVKETEYFDSLVYTANFCLSQIDTLEKQDSVSLEFLTDVISKKAKKSAYIWNNSEEVASHLDEFLTTKQDIILAKQKLKKVIENHADKHDVLTHYVVKARIDEDNNPKVIEYHGYKNENGKWVWKLNEMKLGEMPDYWMELGETIMETMVYLKSHSENSYYMNDLINQP